MFVNSNENHTQESDQFFSIRRTVVETQASQTAEEGFGFETERPGFGKSRCDASISPWLYQKMLVRRLTNKVQGITFFSWQMTLQLISYIKYATVPLGWGRNHPWREVAPLTYLFLRLFENLSAQA